MVQDLQSVPCENFSPQIGIEFFHIENNSHGQVYITEFLQQMLLMPILV
jgi:hypothetical protein